MVAQQAELVDQPDVTYLGFNQDQTCLAVGTRSGFRIFSTESFTLLHQEACGAVSLIEMLFRTSLLALVGCSVSSLQASAGRRLSMWNTKERCSICQLHFSAMIHGVKMNHRRIVVLLELKIHIFDLKTMKSLHVIDRTPSAFADASLGWLCAASERGYLATPLALAGAGPEGGPGLHSWHCSAGPPEGGAPCGEGGAAPGPLGGGECAEARLGLVTIVDTYTLKPVGTVLAHRSPVQALCLNPTGQLLATASTKGTVIRVFSVPALDTLYSFRRGASACRIFGLLFSRDSAHIVASAASGTVHVFRNSERKLGALPLQSEEATVGAAQREMISQVVPPETAPQRAPVPVPPAEWEEEDGEELEDWNVVAERPECLFAHWPGGGAASLPTPRRRGSGAGGALQALAAASEFAEFAAESTAKYAKSLLQLLPQHCRELVDAPRAFAWVHLREEERPRGCEDAGSGAEALLARLPGQAEGPLAHGRYVACLGARRRGRGRAEVLVATVRGCAHVYDWNPAVGGECRLRTEHSVLGQILPTTPQEEDPGLCKARADEPTPAAAA